jgi:hypothetical protein
MANQKDFFTRIRAAERDAPPSAYAVEIPSNEFVTGNLNSKHMYNQTKEENNGNGGTGSHSSGELNKMASNRYLEKIASVASSISWPKRLLKNVKEAEPLTQVGIAGGALIGAGKAKSWYDDKQTKLHHSTLEERSLKTLQSINRNLAKSTQKV